MPTTYAEIWAWQSLRRITLDPWELEAILKLDSVFLNVMAEAEKRRKNVS